MRHIEARACSNAYVLEVVGLGRVVNCAIVAHAVQIFLERDLGRVVAALDAFCDQRKIHWVLDVVQIVHDDVRIHWLVERPRTAVA